MTPTRPKRSPCVTCYSVADTQTWTPCGKKQGKKGRETGQLALVLRQLQRALGQIPEDKSQRIHQIDGDGLTELAEALLDVRAKSDLATWLERRVRGC